MEHQPWPVILKVLICPCMYELNNYCSVIGTTQRYDILVPRAGSFVSYIVGGGMLITYYKYIIFCYIKS